MTSIELVQSCGVATFTSTLDIKEIKSHMGKVFQACPLWVSMAVIDHHGRVVMAFAKNSAGKVTFKKFRASL